MSILLRSLFLLFSTCAAAALAVGGQQAEAASQGEDLAKASPQELLKVYAALRNLSAGDQTAVAENVVWKRDAGTFTFRNGQLVFAGPVAGRVVAAVFTGEGTFELAPPGAIEQHQIARFTKNPRLQESFRQAVFFFTDDSWAELQKLVHLRSGGAGATAPAAKILAATEKQFQEHFNSWWANQRNGYPPARNLAARLLADLSDPSSKGFFLADIKTEHAGQLLYHLSWNRDLLLLPGFANGEEVMLLRVKPDAYFEWWAGFHLSSEYAAAAHPIIGRSSHTAVWSVLTRRSPRTAAFRPPP